MVLESLDILHGKWLSETFDITKLPQGYVAFVDWSMPVSPIDVEVCRRAYRFFELGYPTSLVDMTVFQ